VYSALLKSLGCALQDKVYIIWVAALLGASDYIGRHLGFYPKLQITKKAAEIAKF